MVKHTTLEASLRGVTIPEMWSMVGSADAFATYHREWHHNEKVRVAEWSRITRTEGDDNSEEHITLTRHVFFMLPIDAPSWFTRAIGVEAVPVLDDQEVTIYKNGNLLLVLRPRLRTPSHERFPHVQVATLEWFFSHEWDSDGTIISKANVTVSASAADLPGWLWALKPTIERVMIWQARKSGRAFLTFCEDRAHAYVAEGRGGKVDANDLLEPASLAWAHTDTLDTAYFDVEEELDMECDPSAHQDSQSLEVLGQSEPIKSTLSGISISVCADSGALQSRAAPPAVRPSRPGTKTNANRKAKVRHLARFVPCLSSSSWRTID
eukprot:jgi/Botrbrau1/18643/Bobra.0367s0079.1